MRIVLINLERAAERRRRMAVEFGRLGIEYQIWAATDACTLTVEDRTLVDRNARRRLGLYPIPDGSLANTLSQRGLMRDLVENGPELMAVFEDDARFKPALPAVLAALESHMSWFDVAVLQRRNTRKTFIPAASLPTGHMLGRVRFADSGSEGYVITRDAARRFLQRTPCMVREIDQALSRFWDNGLNVLYVDPPVVWHGGETASQIEETRRAEQAAHRQSGLRPTILARRLIAGIHRDVRRRIAFRRLLREDRERFGRKYVPTSAPSDI